MNIDKTDLDRNKVAVKDFSVELKTRLEVHFSSLSKPVLNNIIEVVTAMLLVLRIPRGWYNRLTLSGIARCMKTAGIFKIRYKRLDRFLRNKNFETEQTISGLLDLTYGNSSNSEDFLPLLIDQTAVGDVQVIAASFSYQGRAIPVATETFTYEGMRLSQKQVESNFFQRLQNTIGKYNNLLFIMDRGYTDEKNITTFNKQGQLYMIRGRSHVIIEYTGRGGKKRRISLGRLPHKQGQAKRYSNVLYHDIKKVRVDIIVYRGKGFKEPWFLIIPPDCEDILSPKQVVDLYRSRMRIEVNFRDFKSWLGVRGLKLEVDKAEKIGRLLVCLAIAYVLLLVMGDSNLARQMRKDIEQLRRKRRHGTRRSLSVLTVALFMATDSFLLSLSNLMKLLSSILNSTDNGLCVAA